MCLLRWAASIHKELARQSPVTPKKTSEISNKPESLGSSLRRPDGLLERVILKVKSLSDMDKKLKKELPSFLRPHSKLGNYENGKISLIVDSSAMASKWHYLKPDLLQKLRSDPAFSGLVSIDIKIDPTQFDFKNTPEKPKARKFSPETLELLKQTIFSTQDSKIREKLEKLLRFGDL